MILEPQLKKRLNIPRDFDSGQRRSLANKVILFIQERTSRGLDIEGNSFAPYSESYVDSKDFSLAGKSKSRVNLRLTDEMMESIELLDHGVGYIVIGFEANSEANNKAVWNQRSDNGPSRMFLGVNDADLERLISQVRVESPESFRAAESVSGSIVQNIIKRLGL